MVVLNVSVHRDKFASPTGSHVLVSYATRGCIATLHSVAANIMSLGIWPLSEVDINH